MKDGLNGESEIKSQVYLSNDRVLRGGSWLVCSMSLGYADLAAVANSLVTERAAVAEFPRVLED